SMKNRIVPQRLSKRSFLALLIHAFVFALVYGLSYCLLYDFKLNPDQKLTLWLTMPAVLVVKLAIFYAMGHCHRSWRYVSFSDLYGLLSSSTVSVLVLLA